jgi:hypothetical protein
MMATMASGMSADGWAYTISAGRRWANNGYFEGTNYSANSLFASVEKRINTNHSLNFTSMFAQNKRGKNSPNTNEINSLVGEKYNSYWGWQEGEKRNSRFKNAEEPLMMLTHYWKVNPKIQINSTIAYQTGKIGNSRFDFKQVDNPDPVYYTNLPSYLLNTHFNGVFIGNTLTNQANNLRDKFIAQPQIDWKDIYRINTDPTLNQTKESKIVLYEDRNDENIVTFNSNIATQISDNVFLNGAINYQDSRTANFRNMLDLLGGSFYTNIGGFGYGTERPLDLDNPDRKLGVGEKYGYNYNINASKFDAFTQFKFIYKKVDFYLAQSFSKSTYEREGLYRNGFWASNSKGKSEMVEFDNFGFKGGLTYKLSGRHFIDFNGIYMSKAPNHKDVFPNARVNNYITEGITNETIKGGDISYVIKTPTIKARLTGYFNEILNQTDINFFYAEGLSGTNAFVAEIVTGINKRNKGCELGIDWQATSTLKFTGVAAFGEYTFTNSPSVVLQTDDPDVILPPNQKANLAGYKQAGMPQKAYSFGIEYRDPKFWWIGVNANYLAENYIDISVIRRTPLYYSSSTIAIDEKLADKYLSQEKFDPIRLINLVGGKSWRIKNKYTIGLFANINNVLDVSYRTGGFEQSRNANYRQDFEDNNPNNGGYSVFGSKYFTGYGRTYTANIYLTF